MRLAYPDLIKQTIHAVVTRPREDALHAIAHAVAARVPAPEPGGAVVQSLMVDELRCLHEGVSAPYGLRAIGVCGVDGAGSMSNIILIAASACCISARG